MPFRAKSSGAKSGWRDRKDSTLPSFSNRLKVQVEYISRPPGLSITAAQSSISACRAAQPAGLWGRHSSRAVGSRRNMPSPEQGASTSTASKVSGQRAASLSGSALTTSALAAPMRSRLPARAFARAGSGSLDTSAPRLSMAAAICVDLPPGAAHKSSMRSPGCASSTAADTMALASCT